MNFENADYNCWYFINRDVFWFFPETNAIALLAEVRTVSVVRHFFLLHKSILNETPIKQTLNTCIWLVNILSHLPEKEIAASKTLNIDLESFTFDLKESNLNN